MALRTSVVSATEDQMLKYKESVATTSARRGRPWNQKSILLPLHPKSLSTWITFHSEEHTSVILDKQLLTLNNIYSVIGPRIPHSETIEKAEGRAFLLLLLYKPRREITQLK